MSFENIAVFICLVLSFCGGWILGSCFKETRVSRILRDASHSGDRKVNWNGTLYYVLPFRYTRVQQFSTGDRYHVDAEAS